MSADKLDWKDWKDFTLSALEQTYHKIAVLGRHDEDHFMPVYRCGSAWYVGTQQPDKLDFEPTDFALLHESVIPEKWCNPVYYRKLIGPPDFRTFSTALTQRVADNLGMSDEELNKDFHD